VRTSSSVSMDYTYNSGEDLVEACLLLSPKLNVLSCAAVICGPTLSQPTSVDMQPS